ncbi:MAG: Methyltransferase type 11 [Gemmatimonadetes bacterium]|nr:Methyltransferase type 11 [Gemmatimonadota bacterium]
MMLSARDGYRLWAPRYETETAVSLLENEIVSAFAVELEGRTLLDVGCGTGRRLRMSGARRRIGVDLSPSMLAHAGRDVDLTAANAQALPFPANAFDVVWCRLVVGHVRDVCDVYRELARVCAAGGSVIISDYSPVAIAAGHRRTFRDDRGVVHELEHYVHDVDLHHAAAYDAALAIVEQRRGNVGPSVQALYLGAGKEQEYLEQRGLELVHAFLMHKRPS